MDFPDGTLTLLVCLLLATTTLLGFAGVTYGCWAHGQLAGRDLVIDRQAARLRDLTGRVLSSSGRLTGRPPARHMAVAESAGRVRPEGRRTPAGTVDTYTVRAPVRTRVRPSRRLAPLDVRGLKADAEWRNGPAPRLGPPTPHAGTIAIRARDAA